ncbi:TraR/DksA family transcriptional regulator [Corallococcus exercitus]|uniref:TraR/DksA family transcriptional regulator n=1 Tax=Corallococcus exercitus TaxID=2316736 RepID=UPI0035D41F2F
MPADPMTTRARQMLLSRQSALRASCAEALPAAGGAADACPPVRGAYFPPHELEEVEAALERIAQGRFGCCEQCGGAIGRQRLLAVPEARCCLTCTDARARDTSG